MTATTHPGLSNLLRLVWVFLVIVVVFFSVTQNFFAGVFRFDKELLRNFVGFVVLTATLSYNTDNFSF